MIAVRFVLKTLLLPIFLVSIVLAAAADALVEVSRDIKTLVEEWYK